MHRAKLAALGARTLTDEVTDPAAATEQLRQAFGGALPDAYLAMLRDYRGPIVFDRSVSYRPVQNSPFDRSDGTQGLEVLYGLGDGRDSVIAAQATYGGRVPASTLPIGAAPGGNQICLVLTGPRTGAVFFWNHDDERQITGEDEHDFGNMYLIANSLPDFIQSLEADPDSVPGGGGIVESESWLDI